MLVSTGSTHNAANPRTTSETANPDSFTDRPNSVSSGRLSCTRIAAANRNGPATHAASATLVLSWADILDHSTHAEAATPRNLMTRAPLRCPPRTRAHGGP